MFPEYGVVENEIDQPDSLELDPMFPIIAWFIVVRLEQLCFGIVFCKMGRSSVKEEITFGGEYLI